MDRSLTKLLQGSSTASRADLAQLARRVAADEIERAQAEHRVSRLVAGVGGDHIEDALREQLLKLDDGDGVISGENVVNFARDFARERLSAADAAKAHRQTRRTLTLVAASLLFLVALFSGATAWTLRGTRDIAEDFHFVETRGDRVTTTDGETLRCASDETQVPEDVLLTRDGRYAKTVSAARRVGNLAEPPPPPRFDRVRVLDDGEISRRLSETETRLSSKGPRRKTVERHIGDLASGRVSSARASHHHRTLTSLFAACHSGIDEAGNSSFLGGAVFLDAPSAKAWDVAYERWATASSSATGAPRAGATDLCLGFNSDSFLQMYDGAILRGAYDDLCCDEASGFFLGPGSNCYFSSGHEEERGINKADAATWLHARDACAELGAHLVMFKDASEVAALAALPFVGADGVKSTLADVEEIQTSGGFWIGYHDIVVEGAPECDSSSGGCESTFTNWHDTPENKGRADCVYAVISERGPGLSSGNDLRWKFDSCDEDAKHHFVCEQTNACPAFTSLSEPELAFSMPAVDAPRQSDATTIIQHGVRRYPCYHQPDTLLDWCEPMRLTDSDCETWGFSPRMPWVAVGYAYFLHGLLTGATPPSTVALTIPSPCTVGATRSFETRFHVFSKLEIGARHHAGGVFGGRLPGESPIGFVSPLTKRFALDPWSPSPAFGATQPGVTRGTQPGGYAPGDGHAICINLRGEVYASAQERTMLELTHCCGTLDYRGDVDRPSGVSKRPALLRGSVRGGSSEEVAAPPRRGRGSSAGDRPEEVAAPPRRGRGSSAGNRQATPWGCPRGSHPRRSTSTTH